MYSRFASALKYTRYYLTAANGKGHGAHSPFVFQFITQILNDRRDYPEYERVESLRKQLRKNNKLVTIEDLGAGSGSSASKTRTISSITKNVAKPAKFGQLLFRMVRNYQPGNILELGTSLGLTTAYLSLANPAAKVISIEGSGQVADLAVQNMQSIGIENATAVRGNFDEILPAAVSGMTALDFVFIDGNHRLEPTKRYFEGLLPKMHNHSVMVFDDIHWSPEMESAWEFIKAHPAVRCSIDLFFVGIVFFRKEFMTRQHFTIRF